MTSFIFLASSKFSPVHVVREGWGGECGECEVCVQGETRVLKMATTEHTFHC